MIVTEQDAEKIMNNDAVAAYPYECCGFMFGTEDGSGNRTVTKALPIHNSATENKERRFVIAPKDYMKAEQYALDNDLLFLGIYHSHPDHPAIPSEHDRVAAQPWFSYVIISVLAAKVAVSRSWVLNDQFQFDEEQYSNQLSHTNN